MAFLMNCFGTIFLARTGILLVLTLGLFLGNARAADEQAVKAAFIPHIAGFVSWPDNVFTNDRTPVRIGIVGDFKLGGNFEAAMARKNLNGRPFTVTHCKALPEMLAQNILLIAPDESTAHTTEIITATAGKPILTIGDAEGFAAAGGIVGFVKENGKMRFEVNAVAAKQRGLKFNSQFLQAAKIVSEEGGKIP
jgi:hypothetical protein